MKYAGAAVIIICSLCVGVYLSGRTKAALVCSENIYRTMKYVRDEICVNMTPTHIILSRIPECAGKTDLYSAFSDSLSVLKEPERRIFSEFCKTVGGSFAEVQRGTFDVLISQYGALLDEKRKKSKDSGKLYISLSAFFGIAAVIMFL